METGGMETGGVEPLGLLFRALAEAIGWGDRLPVVDGLADILDVLG